MNIFFTFKSKQLFTILSVLFSVVIQAQNFTEQTGTNNFFDGIDSGNYSTPTFADLDNDGDLDLITGGTDGTFKFYENRKNVFTQLTGGDNPFFAIDVGGYSSSIFVDMDNDGDLDLICGSGNGFVGGNGFLDYYINFGTHFTRQTGSSNPFNGINVGTHSIPKLADLDNDGDLDLICGNFSGTFSYYTNNGSNVFIQQTGTNNPFNNIDVGISSSPTLVDLDKDGDLDLISGEAFGTFKYFTNNVSNGFTEQIGTSNPFNSFNVGLSSTPTFEDLDKDGDLDLISGEKDGTFKYYINDGTLSIESENSINTQLSIFPNPASTNLNIELHSNIKTVEVYNLLGKKMNINNFDNSKINVSKLSKGIYVLKIVDENGSALNKCFVKK